MRSFAPWCIVLAAAFACRHDPNATPDPGDVSRFVGLARPGLTQADLESATRSALGVPLRVEELFPEPGAADLPAEMRRMYRVTAALPGTGNPWDAADHLRRSGAFERVEPDFDDAARPHRLEAAETALCLLDPGVPAPADEAWALRTLRVPQAWALEPPPGGRRYGEGVRVCHPDTGWADHIDLDVARIDLARAWNVMDWSADARDPLDYDLGWVHRGHGTATASVIMSSGGVALRSGTTAPGAVTGVAPAATLVPLRTVKSVMQVFDSDVARAVYTAVRAECDVVSMSLGGRAFFGLRAAIAYAVQQGLVVVAAAGNCIGTVVPPAVYPETIAVAATNARNRPWHGSSHGVAVDICAPGEDVYRALRTQPAEAMDRVEPSDGTSYATAEVAGAAALWLAYKTRAAIEAEAAPGETVQDVFRRSVVAAARPPAPPQSWDTARYGPGILDVQALLSLPLEASPARAARAAIVADDEIDVLARILNRPRPAIDDALVRRFGPRIRERELQQRVLPELSYLALRSPEALESFLATAPDRPAALLRRPAPPFSQELRDAVLPVEDPR